MFRKKAASRFEYLFAGHRTIKLKRWNIGPPFMFPTRRAATSQTQIQINEMTMKKEVQRSSGIL